MKSYKLNIKSVIGGAGLLLMIGFSIILFMENIAHMKELGKILIHFGIIILPIYLLWELTDFYLWHTRPLQAVRRNFNFPPDLRGRWEGILANADGSAQQKFVIEIKQTLTKIRVYSFSSIGHSSSVLAEIASDEHEDNFALCYLWEGESNTSIKELNQGEKYQGYTILHLNEGEKPKVLNGYYFTSRKPLQTRGGIELKWVSLDTKRKID